MNFAIVGAGLIGAKRLKSFRARHVLIGAADLVLERAESLANQYPGAAATTDWQALVQRPDVDAVVVATTNDALAPVCLAAISAGKHVMVEKPAARTKQELDEVTKAASTSRVIVQVGLNHRYHPALRKAREIVDSGVLGPLMFVRGRYGHGGRVGYDREWRANPEVSGGGELIDQGVHLIDLARWFLGEFTGIEGHALTYFWDMPVDDNAFLCLRTPRDQVAWLHVSCTEWKNMFSLEIYGRDGKLDIRGLGGSYGVESIAYYKMLPQMGPPETTMWEFPGEDVSWSLEMADFERAIATGRTHGPTLADAAAALTIIGQIYAGSGYSGPQALAADSRRREDDYYS